VWVTKPAGYVTPKKRDFFSAVLSSRQLSSIDTLQFYQVTHVIWQETLPHRLNSEENHLGTVNTADCMNLKRKTDLLSLLPYA